MALTQGQVLLLPRPASPAGAARGRLQVELSPWSNRVRKGGMWPRKLQRELSITFPARKAAVNMHSRTGGWASQDAPGQHPLTSWLNIRVGKMCERKAGDAGGRDGEPGVRRRLGPALLHAPGRWRWRKVLRSLQRWLGTKKVTRCL